MMKIALYHEKANDDAHREFVRARMSHLDRSMP